MKRGFHLISKAILWKHNHPRNLNSIKFNFGMGGQTRTKIEKDKFIFQLPHFGSFHAKVLQSEDNSTLLNKRKDININIYKSINL
jgi:hypothetical protein